MLQILFAITAGILTVSAPCILPMLPILLGSSISGSKTRPVFIALGFIVMFTITGLVVSTITTALHISPNLLRSIATIALGIFGLFMIWPRLFELLTIYLNRFINSANSLSNSAGNDNLGGFVLGLMLGIIWAPCAGPILGSILTLIATQQDIVLAGILLFAYSVGAGIPLMLIAYGGQAITSKIKIIAQYSNKIQQIFGVIIIILSILIYFQYDTIIQARILQNYNFGNLELKIISPK